MILDPLTFILAALAVYRLSLMVSKEDGPAWLFYKLRRLPPPKSSAREGLACQWCVSVYAAALVCGLLFWAGLRNPAPLWIILWLALSAAAVVINQAFTKGKA